MAAGFKRREPFEATLKRAGHDKAFICRPD